MRNGIISAGNWLADYVKIIDRYPAPGNLVTIRKVEQGLGGCSHNVLVDLARMQTHLPLYAGGCVGDDALGHHVLAQIAAHGIDATHMTVLPGELTAYTDVMVDQSASTRTFFHCRGANARLDVEHLVQMATPARIFHLGYLLLLDRLDEPDAEYGVRAARALHQLQEMGYETSVDVVSEQSDRFKRIILPCLPYVHHLVINEVEAQGCTGFEVRRADGSLDRVQLEAAARFIMDCGVRHQVTIHFPEGGYTLLHTGEAAYESSWRVEAADIVSTVGAGDAFCAGMLYAIHQRMDIRQALRLANASARFNLRSATCTDGAPTLAEIEQFLNSHP